MRRAARHQASQALLTLADLIPAAPPGGNGKGSIPLEWFRWLPLRSVALFANGVPDPLNLLVRSAGRRMLDAAANHSSTPVAGAIDRDLGDRLASVDQLRVGERALRVGWLFVAGQVEGADGRTTRVFQPLITRPVQVRRDLGMRHAVVDPAGDLEIHAGVKDPDLRERFEAKLQLGGGGLDQTEDVGVPAAFLERLPALTRFAKDLARAAGFPTSSVISAGAAPDELLHRDRLALVVGVGIYVARPTEGVSNAASIAGWVEDGLTDSWTSFHSLYVDEATPPEAPAERPEVELSARGTKPISPFPLTPAQRMAVLRSRRDPITVIAGAPGTGKSHTIAAIACDALARGESVLVGAKSDATIDALVAMFERTPGPQPVVFGSNERKDALAARLARGQSEIVSEGAATIAREALEVAVAARDAAHAVVATRLRAEASLDAGGDEALLARASFPMLFAADVDLDHIGGLIAVASHAGGGWLTMHRQRAATAALDELSGADDDASRRSFVAAFRVARDARAAAALLVDGGLDLQGAWSELHRLEALVRERAAAWLSRETRSEHRFTRSSLEAIAALATALRSGRAVRRERLRHLDATITRALPLWVGTLADIEDLLPRAPGLFDVLVLDEASSIDQPLATPGLLRSKKAVVVGDPRQLRHVSFLADEQRDAALVTNGVSPQSTLAAKLDVRRNSTFDLAAGVTPVLTLDEHFRCAPHLVDFVARRLYGDELKIATRSPSTESVDCVDIVRVEGRRDDGVVRAEVDEVIRQLHHLHSRREASVGVITPFRAQADAIEAAVLSSFTHDAIDAMGLRVGTVHAFQGNEREVVLISLGVGTEGSAGSWRFVQDPHLFTVLVTRARRRLLVIAAGDPPARGLLADYLAQQDSPPGPPAPIPLGVPWVDDLAADLRRATVPATAGYPSGRHVVDICVGTADGFFGVEATVHPEGADAHIERHLSLMGAGWRLHEAHRSRWGDRRGELVVDLVQALAPDAVMGGHSTR